MELSTSLTAVLTVLAVLGLGYYGTDYVLDDQGLSEEDLENANDSNTPGVNQETGDGDTLGEEREIKGRDSNDSENESGEESSNEELDGIVMSSDPVAGENTRIALYDEGSRVTGETVYLDGEEIGETSQTGALTFEVPNKEEITITTDSGLDEFTKSVEGYDYMPVNFNLIRPTDGATIDDYAVNLVAGIETEEDINYEILVDGQSVSSSTLESGESMGYDSIEYIDSSGTHEWKIIAENQNGREFTSEEREFQTTEDKINNSVELISPVSSDIDSHRANIRFNISAARDYSYTLNVDGEEFVSASNIPAGNREEKISWKSLDPKGEHSYSIALQSEDNEISINRSSSFNILNEPPLAEFHFENMGGLGNNTETSGDYVSISFQVYPYEDLEGELIFEGEPDQTYSFTAGEDDAISQAYEGLEPGSYEWYVRARSDNGESIRSDSMFFEVTE